MASQPPTRLPQTLPEAPTQANSLAQSNPKGDILASGTQPPSETSQANGGGSQQPQPSQLKLINIGNYNLGRDLGKGTFGKVKVGTHILTGEKVAVKILEKDKIVDVSDVERVAREIHILKIVRHPHVVQLYEIIETSKELYLIMEYARGGELFEYIVHRKRVREKDACRFMHQILSGIEYLHKLGVCHRDLKPENLLMDEHNNIKIVDFGLSNTYKENQTLKTACGSPCYAAPEMIAGKRYNGLLSDIWSSGVILFAMVCGYLPFEDPNTNQLYKKIMSADFTIPQFLSPDCQDLISKILVTDPATRMTIQQIREHPWYNLCKVRGYSGIIVGKNLIPVDESILESLKEYNFDVDQTRVQIETNRHNQQTTAYQLLLKKFIRSGGKSVADLTSYNAEKYFLLHQQMQAQLYQSQTMASSPAADNQKALVEFTNQAVLHLGGPSQSQQSVQSKTKVRNNSEVPQKSTFNMTLRDGQGYAAENGGRALNGGIIDMSMRKASQQRKQRSVLHQIEEMLPNVPAQGSTNKYQKPQNPPSNVSNYGQTVTNGFEMPFMYYTPRDAIKFQSKQISVSNRQSQVKKASLNQTTTVIPGLNIKIKPRPPMATSGLEKTKIGFYQGQPLDPVQRASNPLNSSLDSNIIQQNMQAKNGRGLSYNLPESFRTRGHSNTPNTVGNSYVFNVSDKPGIPSSKPSSHVGRHAVNIPNSYGEAPINVINNSLNITIYNSGRAPSMVQSRKYKSRQGYMKQTSPISDSLIEETLAKIRVNPHDTTRLAMYNSSRASKKYKTQVV